MDKVKSIVTGDAYKKPAKTEAGAFTTQDSDNAHTTSGTSAEDPNIPGSGKIEQGVDKGMPFLFLLRILEDDLEANEILCRDQQ